jgi:hypothetical protein
LRRNVLAKLSLKTSPSQPKLHLNPLNSKLSHNPWPKLIKKWLVKMKKMRRRFCNEPCKCHSKKLARHNPAGQLPKELL